MLKHTHTKTLMKKMRTAGFQQSSCLKQNHFTYNWTFKLWFWLILWVLRDSRSLCFQMWALTDTSSSCRWSLESSVERESSKCNTSKENEWIVKSGWFQTWAVVLCFLCSRPMTTDIITCKRHILSCDLWVVWHVSEVSTDLSRPSSLSKRVWLSAVSWCETNIAGHLIPTVFCVCRSDLSRSCATKQKNKNCSVTNLC